MKKKEDRSNFDELSERLQARKKDCAILLKELDGYIDSYDGFLHMETLPREMIVGSLMAMEDTINQILKMLGADIKEIAQIYSYLQVYNQVQINTMSQPDYKSDLSNREIAKEIDKLQKSYESMEGYKQSFVNEYNSIIKSVEEMLAQSRHSLGVDENYNDETADFENMDEDAIMDNIGDMSYEEFEEALEDIEYPELTDEEKYGDEPDFHL